MIRSCAVLILLLAAATGEASTREAVIAEYVAALGRHRFEEAARLIRARDLADYKDNFSILFRAEAQDGKRQTSSRRRSARRPPWTMP